MLNIATRLPHLGADSVGHKYPAVFVIPMTPSPIMIIVNKDSLSFMCVSLKLSILQTDDIETMTIASAGRRIHHII
jgi:hypothetical protein